MLTPMTRARSGRTTGPLRGLLVLLAVLVAGCIPSVPPAADVLPVSLPVVTLAPTEPPEPVTEDVELAIQAYWAARDAAFATSAEAGLAFLVANNHPSLPYTAEECAEAWFEGQVPPGFAERTALLDGSIESDPGWTMRVGPLAGRPLEGGIFRMVTAFAYDGTPLRIADRVAYVHLQVGEGTVRHFLLCEDVEPTVVVPTQAPTTTAAAPPVAGGTTTTTTPATPTAPTPIQSDPITLPPITATPQPGGGSGGGGGGTGGGSSGSPQPTPTAPGTRPPGSGIDFCSSGDPGAQPAAGDYYLCPDDDIDNSRGQDGGSSEPTPAPEVSGQP